MEREGGQDAKRVQSRWEEEEDVPYVKVGNFVLKADFDLEGDEFSRERARNELRETPEIVEQSLKDFRAMIKGKRIKGIRKWRLDSIAISIVHSILQCD